MKQKIVEARNLDFKIEISPIEQTVEWVLNNWQALCGSGCYSGGWEGITKVFNEAGVTW